jgi:peroxiredoxin
MMKFSSVVLLIWGATTAVQSPAESPPGETGAGARFKALAREHRTAVRQFWAAHEKLSGKDEKRKFFIDHFVQPGPYIRRFLEIVESAPNDQAAVDSLIWVVENGGFHAEVNQAIERLATKYSGNKRLGEIAPWLVTPLVHSLSPSPEKLLSAIIANNPDRAVQGQACMALAEYLNAESRLVRVLSGDANQARQTRFFFMTQGADAVSLATVAQRNPDELLERSKATFERARREYSDVRDYLRLVDQSVQAKLWENPDLGIGKVAPEIVGEDLDGRPLKLSDYRGKVVVLVFWGDWNGPSRAMYPQWRSMAKRMEGKPCIVLGVNSDNDKEKLKRRASEEQINWRSWWDSGGEKGPIAAQFKLPGWPTTYILDHRGTIRHKFLWPPHHSFDVDEAIDNLITAAAGARR